MAKLYSVRQFFESNISSITHTAALGSITPVTSVNKVANRSVLDAYSFTYTGIGTKTLTINLSSTIGFNSISILGMHSGISVQSIKAFNGFSQLSTSTLVHEQIRNINGENLTDITYSMDSGFSTCNKIEFIYSDVNTGTGQIGVIMPMSAENDFHIKPDGSFNYTFASIGNKVITEGGQVFGTFTGSYRKCRFTTTAVIQSTINNPGGLVDINYQSGTIEPLIFIPDPGDSFLFYGTQNKPFTVKQVLGKIDNVWLQECTFDLVEEF